MVYKTLPRNHLSALRARFHWIIAGGESGPNARPAHPDWFRSVRDQCKAAAVPFFFKQWGEWEVASRENGHQGSVMPDTGEKYTWVGYDGKTQNPSSNGMVDPVWSMARVGKRRAGRLLDGREWNEFPRGTDIPVCAQKLAELHHLEGHWA